MSLLIQFDGGEYRVEWDADGTFRMVNIYSGRAGFTKRYLPETLDLVCQGLFGIVETLQFGVYTIGRNDTHLVFKYKRYDGDFVWSGQVKL
jgi:hypothetical protein